MVGRSSPTTYQRQDDLSRVAREVTDLVYNLLVAAIDQSIMLPFDCGCRGSRKARETSRDRKWQGFGLQRVK